MLSTKYETDAPGAYHAEVPRSLVKVAPPTIVDFEISESFCLLKKLLTGNPL